MAHKVKKIYPCNLLALRENLGLTQKELGEILGVSERMVCNYETTEATLPLDKAMILSKKYNYTLDWIYSPPASSSDESPAVHTEKEHPKFFVDIREFISYSNNSIHFTFPDYYMEYIKERNRLESLKEPIGDKKRRLAELDGKYKIQKGGKYWRITLKDEEISSYLRFDSKFIPFADFQYDSEIEPAKEQTEEVISLLKELSTAESEEST